MQVETAVRLANENKLLHQELEEKENKCVTETSELRKANDKLCRQVRELQLRLRDSNKINQRLHEVIREKEQLLAEVTRHVAKAQNSGWTVGETVSGPPEDFGLPSDGEARKSKLASRAIGTPKADDIEKVLGERRDHEGIEGAVEQRIRQIVHEELSRVYRLTDSAPSETALLTGLERGPS